MVSITVRHEAGEREDSDADDPRMPIAVSCHIPRLFTTHVFGRFSAMSRCFGLSMSLPHILGHQRAAELLYTARRVAGVEAHAIGLVDRRAEDGDVRAAAVEFAEAIAAQAPLAVLSIRETLRRSLAGQV